MWQNTVVMKIKCISQWAFKYDIHEKCQRGITILIHGFRQCMIQSWKKRNYFIYNDLYFFSPSVHSLSETSRFHLWEYIKKWIEPPWCERLTGVGNNAFPVTWQHMSKRIFLINKYFLFFFSKVVPLLLPVYIFD